MHDFQNKIRSYHTLIGHLLNLSSRLMFIATTCSYENNYVGEQVSRGTKNAAFWSVI